MELNLEFYKDTEDIISDTNKEIIEKYINNYSEEEYEKIFENDNRLEVVLALSEIRKNIVNWYPFNENSTILEINGNLGEVTGELCKKCKKVVTIEESKTKAEAILKRHSNKNNLEIIVGNISEIEFKEQFDYIFVNGELENAPLKIKSDNPFQDFLNILLKHLKQDGKLLIATDNKFGIRYWNGKKDLDGSYEYRNLGTKRDNTKTQLFTEKTLNNMLKKLEITNINFYYMFPDYKMPNLIYNKEYKISKEDISRNFTCYEENELVSFVENDVLRELIKEDSNLINFYANSFFIECSKEKIDTDIKYVSYTNYRKKEYRIMTIIKKDVVQKIPVSEISQKHIDNIKNNIKKLKGYNINVLEREIDNYLESEYLKDAKRYDILIDEIETLEETLEYMKPYIEKLYENSVEYDNIDKSELKQCLKECEEDVLKEFKYLEYSFLDFIPKNIFYINNQLYTFDQEWMEKYIPVEHLIYRAIINSNLYRKFSDRILDVLNLTKNRDLFNKIEAEFGQKVIDNIMLDSVFGRKTRNRNDLLKEIDDKEHIIKNDNIKIEEYEQKIKEYEVNLLEQKSRADDNETKMNEYKAKVDELTNTLDIITNSRSWKITRPLRNLNKYLK